MQNIIYTYILDEIYTKEIKYITLDRIYINMYIHTKRFVSFINFDLQNTYSYQGVNFDLNVSKILSYLNVFTLVQNVE